jgi:uncharacterized membrane protein YkoI
MIMASLWTLLIRGDWMFGIEIDNKDGNTAELYVIAHTGELSMDDEISLTING